MESEGDFSAILTLSAIFFVLAIALSTLFYIPASGATLVSASSNAIDSFCLRQP